jgi:hypothetical protein
MGRLMRRIDIQIDRLVFHGAKPQAIRNIAPAIRRHVLVTPETPARAVTTADRIGAAVAAAVSRKRVR